MKNLSLNLIFFTISALFLASCEGEKRAQGGTDNSMQADAGQQNASAIIEDWPETPRNVANKMIEKYGEPAEFTESMLIWYNSGDWKRTIVYKEEVEHRFPKPHTDLLEQTIDYQYDLDKYDEMVAYDGSVFAERTKGELSARCDVEAMNYLAINLAYDVEQGNKTVEEAREFYARTAHAFMQGESSEYTQGFIFKLPKGETKDPDKAIMEEVMG